LPWQEYADSSSVLSGCLAAPNRDVPLVFFCQLLNYPEAKACTGNCFGSKERQKSLINRSRIESFAIVEDCHSHSRATAVWPIRRCRNPQVYRSVGDNSVERVRHQVREHLTNLALASQQNGAVANLS